MATQQQHSVEENIKDSIDSAVKFSEQELLIIGIKNNCDRYLIVIVFTISCTMESVNLYKHSVLFDLLFVHFHQLMFSFIAII